MPPELALWLFGLGIEVRWNPPCRPQDNGVVERSQGVGANWAEPGLCTSVRQLQRRFNEEDRIQREEYPSIAGQSRLAAYPNLRHSGRRYSWAWEQRHWDSQHVAWQLAGYVVGRRVDCCGKIGVYHHKLYIGTQHQGQEVLVQLDPERREWVVSSRTGQQLHRTPAAMLQPQRIRRLQVAQRRGGKTICRD